MRDNCAVCHSEGFNGQSRAQVRSGSRQIIASLNFVSAEWLAEGYVGLSESAWLALTPDTSTPLELSHPPQIAAMSAVRGKIYGQRFQPEELEQLMKDIVSGQLTDVEIAAFVATCGGDNLNRDEVLALTQAMINAGTTLHWQRDMVIDKHCVGGLPGNRTTPIVVAIATACGLTMPKTSSRAITSPAGTADTMETLTQVSLNLEQMRQVVDQVHGCLVWGGAVHLSPGDDILIRIGRALDIDSPSQLVASVLSKKAAAGANHVLIDIPVGPTAKVRNAADAEALAALLRWTGERVGLTVKTLITDGSQPIGRGIGPALEARDVLAVLQGQEDAPASLRQRALLLSGALLELAQYCSVGQGVEEAQAVLDSGRAWQQFQAICHAQGGLKTPPWSRLQHPVVADQAGRISAIDNRRLAKLAKLAGAPASPAAGLMMQCELASHVNCGTPLMTLHADSQGELQYALAYLRDNPDIIVIDPA